MERRSVIIVGPTCSGKTSLSLCLAKILDTEIVSADSRQIFKYLDVGTAKPDNSQLKSVKHHFINYLNPDEPYNVSRYEKEALSTLNELIDKNKIPVVVGGSGLYIKALVDGIVDVVDTDYEYREELLKIKNEEGQSALYELLQKCDPVSASTMLPQNWKRVIRALEVYKLSGKFIWQIHDEQKRDIKIKFIQFGLNWNRDDLYQNINNRVDLMMESGLVEEVSSLIIKYDDKLNAFNTVGYKEIIAYLKNEISLERAVELIKRNTRRYAKRQFTWFNADKRINWIDVNPNTKLDNIADFIYNKLLE